MVHKVGVHTCPDCPKTFSRLEYVARHRRLKHLGIRPWCCECGSSYARSDLLTRHKRKCKGKRPISSRTRSKDLGIEVESPDYHQPDTLNISSAQQCGPLHDDNEPPSYQQAITSRASTSTRHISASISQSPKCSSPLPSNLPSNPSVLVAVPHHHIQETATSSAGSQNHKVEFGLDDQGQAGLEPQPTLLNQVDLEREQPFCDRGQVKKDGPDSTSPGDPFDSIVPYIQPNFFINDVPESSPFYLNPNIWVLAFLCQRSQGFTIPQLGTLSRFVSRATQVICPLIPMIHVPTFKTTLTTIHLGYALSVAGAASEKSDYAVAFTEQSLTYKRPLVQNDFLSRKNGFNFRFELLQTLLVYHFVGMFSHLESQRNRSIEFGQTIVENFRDLGFVENLRNTPDYIHLALSGEVPLDLAWKLWVNYEVQKRTAFLVLILSLQLKGSGLRLAEADLPLPCHEDLWMAKSATEWAQAAQNHAMGCLIDNVDRSGSLVKNLHYIESITMQQTSPLLSEALAALHLSGDRENQNLIPDVHHVGERRLTIRADRMGYFARTVIHHTRALAYQATVRTGIFEHHNYLRRPSNGSFMKV